MLPHFTNGIELNPEQEADIKKRLDRMHARSRMPTVILPIKDGYVARRDGNSGYGKTRAAAMLDLTQKEIQDAMKPSPPVGAKK